MWKTIRNRISPLLQNGLSAKELVATVCLASAIGILPVVWGTTFLCAGCAFIFRLNQAAVQAVNYLVYPLQLALFVPFLRLGAAIVPWGRSMSPDSLRLGQLTSSTAMKVAGWAMAKAVVGWAVTVPPVAILMFLLLSRFPMVRRRER